MALVAMPAQRGAQRHARRGPLQALAQGGQTIGRQRQLALQREERQARLAQRAADPDVVARAGAVAPQRLARGHLAQHGDADVQRPGGGVAAHQRAAVLIGQCEQAARQSAHPRIVARTRRR